MSDENGNTQHTPGPWSYAGTGCLVGGPDRLRIADTYCPERAAKRPGYGECSANARLIAAAPEMLDALRYLVRASEARDRNATEDALIGARAAISKARGGV